MNKLLLRDDFRNEVAKRDNNRCIICGEKADESHHIVERKLWSDEGYYMNNGASLCNHHHKQAENDTLCPQYLRHLLQINTITPPNFDNTIDYNKWGTPYTMPREYNFKYPTTWYMYFSPSIEDVDKRNVHNDLKQFVGIPVVITIKMDGSNSRIEHEKVTARNGFSAEHISFDMLKALHRKDLMFKIPENIVIFGEWLFAEHSIIYDETNPLYDYFQCFSIYNRDKNIFLDWKETKKMCSFMGLSTVPVIDEYRIFNTEWELVKYLNELGEKVVKDGHEGIVMRSAYGYHFSQHKDFVVKYVRKNHIQTDKNWWDKPVKKNIVDKTTKTKVYK